MPNSRHPDDGLILRSYAVTHPRGLGLPPTGYADWDQLAYASRGVLRVSVGQDTWVIPPNRALWIPAGTTVQAGVSGRVTLRTLYFRKGFAGRGFAGGSRAIEVSPLLRELILHASLRNTIRRDDVEGARLVRVLLDQLKRLAVAPLSFAMPTETRARESAELIITGGGTPTSVARTLKKLGMSRRTLERSFAVVAGLTLGRWCQRVRLMHALTLLGEGASVTQVALKIEYNSPSAFIAAFRREFGTTPARYFA